MNFKDLQLNLINLTKLNISKVDIANALGVHKSNITYKIKNGNEVRVDELNRVAEHFKVDVNLLNMPVANQQVVPIVEKSDNCISIDYYPEQYASCGNGTFVLSNNVEQLQVPQHIFGTSKSQKYFAITARGNSMQPHILPDDVLIVRNCENENIYDEKIYVFYYNDCIYTKRLVMNIDEILVLSDNPEYEKKSIKEFDKFKLIGEVIGLMRKE